MISKPLILIALLPLAGCISFGAKPPPSLLTLNADTPVPVGQQMSSSADKPVTISVPTVPQALATTRLPVETTATSIAYVKDAAWAEPPANLFARLMADTLTARGGHIVLSGAQAITDPGTRLGGELRRFGFDASAQQAVVVYDASLIRAGQTAVEQRRFQAMVPVSTIDAQGATAINQAANQVAGQVADWVGR